MTTRKRTIGGTLTLDALATLYRPTDAVVVEIRRLHQSGHSVSYIADSLRVASKIVAAVLAEQPPA